MFFCHDVTTSTRPILQGEEVTIVLYYNIVTKVMQIVCGLPKFVQRRTTALNQGIL